MSTTLGFRYLYAADYINREMDLWFHVRITITRYMFTTESILQERNQHYVVHIEVFLAKVFNFLPSSPDDDEDIM